MLKPEFLINKSKLQQKIEMTKFYLSEKMFYREKQDE